METAMRCGRLLAVALVICATLPVGAQAGHGAVDVNPDNTVITGTADFPTLGYEAVIIQCDTGALTGTTGSGQSDIVDFEPGFADCNVNGLDATVSCAGTARWHALSPTEGEIDRLNQGFLCTITVSGVCAISVGAQELPIPGGLNRADPIDGAIEIEVDMEASRSGSSLCGPTSGVMRWTGTYELDPEITLDPPF
jgi:hypothetical protein